METHGKGSGRQTNGKAPPSVLEGPATIASRPASARTLGEQISGLIARLGLRADELAELCSVTRKTGRRVLAGDRRLSRAVLLKVCDGLGLAIRVEVPDVETWERIADWVESRRKLAEWLRSRRPGQ